MARWLCGSDYSTCIPDKSGNYAIFIIKNRTDLEKKELVYIGTAKNLYVRLKKHEVIKVIRALTDYWVVIKFKVIYNGILRKHLEAKLIKRLEPRINYV